MKHKFIGFCIFLFLVVSTVSALTVSPLTFKKDVNPGDNVRFTVQIVSAVDDTISIGIENYIHTEEGKAEVKPFDENTQNLKNWVDIPSEINVKARITTNLNFTVNIPLSARGTYVFAVVLEPGSTGQYQNIYFKARFAVIVLLRVQAPGLRTSYEIEEFEIVPDDNKQPMLKVKLKNNSKMDYFTIIDASVRDSERKPLEKIRLINQQVLELGRPETWILPGESIIFTGKIEEIRLPGQYYVHLFVTYDDRQRILTKTFDVEKENYLFSTPEELLLHFDNPNLVVELTPRSIKTEVIRVLNKGDKTINVELTLEDIRKNYINSMLSWINMRSENYFELASGRSAASVVTINVPQETENGAYYAKLKYTAFDGLKEISQKDFLLCALVGRVTPAATLIEAIVNNIEYEYTSSVLIKNTGKMHISELTGTLSLYKAGSFLPSLSFALEPSHDGWILPGDSIMMVGTQTGDISDGEYTCVVEIKSGDTTVVQHSFELSIKKESEKVRVLEKPEEESL
ncbi:MAG: hypothetical protein FXF54_13775 [Kosmotoga sp.]|nr:MAG: hypothetical protein FXF54_13775 [Kosmotoga sp.]